MSGKMMGLLVAAIVIGVLIFGLWFQRQHPRQIVGTGHIAVERKSPDGVTRITLRTREIDIAGRRISEVELPGGTWIDCAGDCRKAVHEAGDGFWHKIDRERGTR